MKYTISILIIFALNYNSFSQEIIKMKKENGVYTMPCEVNGLRLKFIFDTGASDVSISLSEAIFMLKNGYLSENDIRGASYYQIANGDIVEGTTINLKTLKIGNKMIYNVEASIVHSLSSPLLLGQSALSKIGKFSFDYSNNTLVLGNGDYNNSTAINERAENNNILKTTMKMAGKLRRSDSPMSAVIKNIPSRASVRIIENKGAYWKVYYSGATGYINEMYLNVSYRMATLRDKEKFNSTESVGSRGTNQAQDEFTTMKMAGKLRRSDSPMSAVIKNIPSRASVRIIENKGAYWKVYYNGATGYINEMYLNVSYRMALMKK